MLRTFLIARAVAAGGLVVTCAAFLGVALQAHHSVTAEYDVNKCVEITGTVVRVEWTNPHGRVFIEAKDAGGDVTHWEFELGSVSVYMRRGWTRNSLKVGDVKTATGLLARKTPRLATAETLTLPDGRKVLIGTSPDEQPTR